MADYYENGVTDKQRQIILNQKVFFVATATKEGTVNLSPRGHDSFRILSKKQVAWIDYPGSGNETARHLKEMDRITLLFCDFEGRQTTVRIFGKGRPVLPNTDKFTNLLEMMKITHDPIIRQIFLVDVIFTSNSCGSGVLVYKYVDEGVLKKKWHKVYEGGKFDEVVGQFDKIPRPADIVNNPTLIDTK